MYDFTRMRTLPSALALYAETQPLRTALEFEGRTTSYAELHSRTDRLAGWLQSLAPGQRLGYLGKNSDRYFELLFATAKAGHVLVPLNWRLAGEEWRFILEDAQASHLFVDDGFHAAGQALAAQIDGLAVHRLDQVCNQASAAEGGQRDDQGENDVVLQIYTSSTTGRPKGVMLTHQNLLALREPGLRGGLPWFPRTEDTSVWRCWWPTPKSIDFVDALPRNPNGKVLRRVLREPYWQGQQRSVA